MTFLELSRAAEQQQSRDREALRIMRERGCDWERAYKAVLDGREPCPAS